ncbi:PH domain-containing protein [Peptostreptococcus russellii]|uniref:PH domain-containing protein n=1 Tax=Peptostreptococcus russellii TaxID=215200 RepID=UPI003F581613
MLTSEDIKKRFEEIGVLDQFGVKKEVSDLPNHIDDQRGEIILYACSAFLDGNTWLMVSTNKKIIFLDKGMIAGLKKIEIPLSKINSISYKSGLVLGEILIHHGSDAMNLKSIDKKALQPMVDSINNELYKFDKTKNIPTNIVINDSDYNKKIVEQNNEIIMLLSAILNTLEKK